MSFVSSDMWASFLNYSQLLIWCMQTTEKYSAPLLGDEVIPGPVNTKANGTADISFTQHTITTGGEEDRHTVTYVQKPSMLLCLRASTLSTALICAFLLLSIYFCC